MTKKIMNYGKETNVLCKACMQRKIFVISPTTVSVLGSGRYLWLKCPSPTCGRVRRYEENELEIH